MSGIKVVRASGNPLKQEHVEEFHKMHAEIYDKVIKKYVKDPSKPLEEALSKRLEKLFNYLNKRVFLKKFPFEGEWPLLTTEEQWMEKIDQYGNISVSKHEGKIVYVILDIEI